MEEEEGAAPRPPSASGLCRAAVGPEESEGEGEEEEEEEGVVVVAVVAGREGEEEEEEDAGRGGGAAVHEMSGAPAPVGTMRMEMGRRTTRR